MALTLDALPPRILKDIELKQAAQTGESLAKVVATKNRTPNFAMSVDQMLGKKDKLDGDGWCRNVPNNWKLWGTKTRFDGTRPHHPYPFGIGLFP